jgi:hypothetical protein
MVSVFWECEAPAERLFHNVIRGLAAHSRTEPHIRFI